MDAIKTVTAPLPLSHAPSDDAIAAPQTDNLDVFDAKASEQDTHVKLPIGLTLTIPARAKDALEFAGGLAKGLAARAQGAAAQAMDTLMEAGFSAVNQAQRLMEAAKNR